MSDHAVSAAGPPAVAATRVKICGVTNVADATFAADAGAWAIGMVFDEASPRACALDQAAAVGAALRRRVELAGVFVNAPLDRIAGVAEHAALTLVQLHGDEGPAFCNEVARRTGARVIKAFSVADAGDVRDAERFHVDFHLMDARGAPGAPRGGTGHAFDWTLLEERRSAVPLILAGGITAANAGEAIARVHPFALDSASGTDSSPGHKDPARVRALIAAAGGAGTLAGHT
ncbi:MAG TPA: phosphoribosylanthranilate isomerase [Solirubrobacteraceae bacterium]|nr:phosphoribosylanthranilate isomerase [Solirubrobacteraceae bacterium]